MQADSHLFKGLKTTISGNLWPTIPRAKSAIYLSLLAQLEYTQWLGSEELQQFQFQQLQHLLSFSRSQVPYYRAMLEGIAGLDGESLTSESWKQIPLLLRADVQQNTDSLRSVKLPSPEHAPLSRIQTSGSTGMPIVAYGTAITRMFWKVFSLREHLWHQRDPMKKTVAIRPEIGHDRESVEFDNWGKSFDMLYRSGPSAALNSSINISAQVEWIIRQQPTYMLSLPSNLKAIANYFNEKGLELPCLEEVRTYGEVVDDELYRIVKDTWNVPLYDMYSTQEVGYIALQCHEHGSNHIQSENLLVEILDDNGNWCQPGETGRVVVTTLHNYGMPLIRYVIGDYAVVGEPCPCGRGLPVLERILGRERNMVILPTGDRHYPSFPADAWSAIAPIRQLQLVQKTTALIEARLAIDRKLSPDEEATFVRVIQQRLKHPFEIRISYHDSIDRSKGGKYEDFISELGV